MNRSSVEPQAAMDSRPTADGITEDVIAALSRYRELFVIARNSVFAHKGKAVGVQQIGRELGVRDVLKGSIPTAV